MNYLAESMVNKNKDSLKCSRGSHVYRLPLRPTPLSSHAKREYRATVIQSLAENHVSTLEKSSSSRCLIKLFSWKEFRRMGYRQLVIRDDFETVPHQGGRTTGDQARTTTSHHNSPNTITHTQYFYWIRLLNSLVDPSWTLLPSSSLVDPSVKTTLSSLSPPLISPPKIFTLQSTLGLYSSRCGLFNA